MAKVRKNKVYKPRLVSAPRILNFVSASDARPDLKLLFHAAVMAFTVQPTVATCNQISKHLCKISGAMSLANNGAPIEGKKDSGSIAICEAIKVIELIGERYDRSEEVTISPVEASILRRCAGKLDAVLSTVPAVCYDKAEKEVDGLIDDEVAA